MMRKLLALLVLCTFAFMQVELYIITVDSFLTSAPDSPIIVEEKNQIDYDNNFKYSNVFEYDVILNVPNEGDEDIPLEYWYVDNNDNLIDIGQTSLCSADLSTTEGTVAAIAALTLGIKDNPVCPLQEPKASQKSVFALQGGNFSNLPDIDDENDILSVKLEIHSLTYLSLKLSITDDVFWFDDDFAQDPDEKMPDDESDDEDEDSSNGQSADEDSQEDEDSSNGQSADEDSQEDEE